MPVEFVRGDLLASAAHVLVIPVNCEGVAGCGLALECRRRYRGWFEEYGEQCATGALALGNLVLSRSREGRTFLNFPTKHHWRYPSHLAAIEEGLQFLLASVGPWHGPDKIMAFPKLGCGAGGLSWDEMCPLMERYVSQLPCLSLVYL
jgi:O-acetyl-ADP-ribose deacetylase (regulator of RNase III)